jgi:acetoacetate decarboxylase
MGFVKTPQELKQLDQMKFDFYDAEMVFVFWLTKSEVVERLLPPPLKPGALPLAIAFVANYPSTSFSLPYREAALFLLAQYEQTQRNYCLSMPVTDDMAMAGGREKFGFPKKMAQVQLGQAGGKTQGYVERNGVRFFELEFTVDEQSVPEDFKNMIQEGFAFHQETGNRGNYLIKSFGAPDDQIFDYPPRLIRQNTVMRPKTIEWGQAHIKLIPSNYDPWYEVEIATPIGAMRIVGDNTMLPGQVLTELDPVAYLPYSFARWDW